MPKVSYDPNKIQQIRTEIENPEGNVVAKLEAIYHIASALEFDGAKELKELLEKEIYAGYGDDNVPKYRDIEMEIAGKALTYRFPDPLSKYAMYTVIDIHILENVKQKAEEVVYHITDGIEKTSEMKSFFRFLYREGTRKLEEERPAEQVARKRERIDFAGLNMEPIAVDKEEEDK